MTTPAQSWIATLEPLRQRFTTPPVYWIALLGPCAAYLQGGFNKAGDFNSAIAEMNHFGLAPAAPFAVAVIVLELGASAMILTGFYRWLGALGLAGFTLMATVVANRFWEMAGPERFMSANSFFEHLGSSAVSADRLLRFAREGRGSQLMSVRGIGSKYRRQAADVAREH